MQAGNSGRLARGICQRNRPSIREAIRKGDAFTNFTYFEAPLLLRILTLFCSLSSRASVLWTRDEFLLTTKCCSSVSAGAREALLKEMGGWEQKVTVRILQANKV